MPALLTAECATTRYAHQGTILMPTWQYRYATVRSSQTPIQRQREKPQLNPSKKESLKTKITLISHPLHSLSLSLSLFPLNSVESAARECVHLRSEFHLIRFRSLLLLSLSLFTALLSSDSNVVIIFDDICFVFVLFGSE